MSIFGFVVLNHVFSQKIFVCFFYVAILVHKRHLTMKGRKLEAVKFQHKAEICNISSDSPGLIWAPKLQEKLLDYRWIWGLVLSVTAAVTRVKAQTGGREACPFSPPTHIERRIKQLSNHLWSYDAVQRCDSSKCRHAWSSR